MLSAVRAYAALAGLVLVIALCAGSYFWGRSNASTKCDLNATRTELAAVQETAAINVAAQSAAAEASFVSAQRHEDVVTRFQPIDREVIRYVQTPAADNACLDDDGLRVWAAANRGENNDAGAIGAGHDALPGLALAGLWPSGRSAGEPRGDGEDLPPVPGTAGWAGGLHPQGAPGVEH